MLSHGTLPQRSSRIRGPPRPRLHETSRSYPANKFRSRLGRKRLFLREGPVSAEAKLPLHPVQTLIPLERDRGLLLISDSLPRTLLFSSFSIRSASNAQGSLRSSVARRRRCRTRSTSSQLSLRRQLLVVACQIPC